MTHYPTNQVCSAWRAAARAPNVWSYLYIDCDDIEVIPRMRFWLSNALQAPLHLMIHASAIHRKYIQAMGLLASRSSQLKDIHISSTMQTVCNDIMAWTTNAKLPLLEYVAVEIDNINDDGELLASESFSKAPLLRSFSLSSPSLRSLISLPLQLVNLHINLKSGEDRSAAISVQLIISALGSLRALRTFRLTISANSFSAIQMPQDPAPIPSDLEAVTLEASPMAWVLLHYLHLPHLLHLHLIAPPETSLGYPDYAAGALLKGFIVASAPPLETLELHDIDISDADFCACFALLKSLRDLRLHSSDISDGSLAGLRRHDGWCPNLRRLDLRWCGTLTGRALVDLVRSRNAGSEDSPRPLIEEITVIHCSFVREEDILELARLTSCRVVHRDGDHLEGHRGCCDNGRYRQRLRLRHLKDFMANGGAPLRLVI
jgi:hypothetical protein